MNDQTIQTALIVLGSVGALAVICIGVSIAVLLNTPDVAALAVLASIASAAAVGGGAGMVTIQQGPGPRSSERQGRTSADSMPQPGASGR